MIFLRSRSRLVDYGACRFGAIILRNCCSLGVQLLQQLGESIWPEEHTLRRKTLIALVVILNVYFFSFERVRECSILRMMICMCERAFIEWPSCAVH